MMTLSEAIAGRGLVESKEIKRVMAERKRAWNSVKSRKYPKGLDHNPAAYIAKFIELNMLKG